MKHFVIFFTEKEGTSAMVRLLDCFDDVSIVHQTEDRGWEPFDWHNSGSMKLGDWAQSMSLIFGEDPVDMGALNQLYLKTAHHPLVELPAGKARGFKMRYRPPKNIFRRPNNLSWRETVARFYRQPFIPQFRKLYTELLLRHDVVVFFAVRQDILRWALSSYHGDGSGGRGHLQFDVAQGKIKPEDIPKIEVDLDVLGRHVQRCTRQHTKRRKIFDSLKQAGVTCYPLSYEQFIGDKAGFLRYVFERIELPVAEAEIQSRLDADVRLKKVHSNDISSFVENHEAVLERFGDAYFAWD